MIAPGCPNTYEGNIFFCVIMVLQMGIFHLQTEAEFKLFSKGLKDAKYPLPVHQLNGRGYQNVVHTVLVLFFFA